MEIKILSFGLAGVFAVAFSAQGAVLVSENFGSLTDADPITTSNTAFNYVRISTGATPVLEAQSPGSFTGSSALLSATTTSLTGLGSSGLAAFDVGSLGFSLKTTALGTNSTFFFGVGSGSMFTGNGTFSGTQMMAGYQILNGAFQVRTGTGSGTWTTVTNLSANTSYQILVSFNGSTVDVTDTAGGALAAGTSNIYVDGVLVINSDITDNLTSDAFRLYTTTSGGSFELDNVVLQGEAVPEPATVLLGALGLLGILRRRR